MVSLSENNIVPRSRHYLCNWCDVKLSNLDSISQHVTKKKHILYRANAEALKLKEDNLIASQKRRSTKYYCFCCNEGFNDLADHINSSFHVDHKLKTLAEDYIVKNVSKKSQKNYHCFFCNDYFDELLKHIKDPAHQTNKESPDKNCLLAENGIHSKPAFYICEWCDVELFAYKMVKNHVDQEKHLFNMGHDSQLLKTLANNFKITECGDSLKYDCLSCDSSLDIVHKGHVYDVIIDHINSSGHINQNHKLLIDNFIIVKNESKNLYYCLFCDLSFYGVFGHVKGPVHKKNESKAYKKSLIRENNIISEPAFYMCGFCSSATYNGKFATYASVQRHIQKEKHKECVARLRMSKENFITVQNTGLGKYHCFICNSNFNEVTEHTNTTAHGTQIFKTLAENFIISQDSQKYYCFFCNMRFDSLMSHMKNSGHQISICQPALISLVRKNSIRPQAAFYFCSLCNAWLSNYSAVKKHVEEKHHLRKMRKQCQENNLIMKR